MAYYDVEEEVNFVDKITIRVGICAMNKKSHSRPMVEILERLAKFDMFEIVVFPDETILNHPAEEWPVCDALISFFSKGFPLNKAIKYSELRKPFLLNDLESQYLLHDRQKVYECLQSVGVSVPRYAVLRRDENHVCDDDDFQESEDTIRVHGRIFHKPFVEKPISAEDHNVYIYFPSQAGGGCQQLFRKIGSLSSRYCDQSQVRKSGSYIYEDFMPTEGTDVKVYTVGPEYVHAEARKSPSLDGKVERDYQGKEIRYPVILSAFEKEIANKVCKAFKQTVCGFDLLRANGMSFVCDVNGFSFVKTSRKYYEDCSQVLGHMILQKIAPQLSIPDLAIEDAPFVDTKEESMLELRCVMAVVRHGDRTPKQKMKMEVRNQMFIDLFNKYGGTSEGKLKLKKPKQLQEVLNIVRTLLEPPIGPEMSKTVFESRHKLEQLKGVLEMYGHFSGINRKIQFKYLGSSRDTINCSAGEDRGRHGYSSGSSNDEAKNDTCLVKNPSLLLIMKWGGELTPFGREQAVEMGKACRCMYPGGRGEYASLPGCGLLRLHSTYRHDLKIYASDEGRVQMTAAAFAKGLLALEGELTPILVHLVRCDKHATKMLDAVGDPQNLMYKIKSRLHEFFNLDKNLTEEDYEKLIPTSTVSQVNALKFIKNPYKMCHRLHSLVQSLTSQLRELMRVPKVDAQEQFLYHNESLDLMVHRWSKLEKDFLLRNGKFDISLIPDIYDCIKYDVFHNKQLNLRDDQELYKCAKALADVVVPQEYGITKDEKLTIARRTCQHLCRKLLGDLRHADQMENMHRLNPKYTRDIVTPHRHVRTRLYFTSESHIHTMINAIRYGNLCDGVSDEFWKRTMDYFSTVPELNYMTQIVLMLYEDPQADKNSDNRFHIELHFSPGVKCSPEEAARDSKSNLSPRQAGSSAKCSPDEETRDSRSNFSSRPPSNDAGEGTGVRCSTEEATRDSQSNQSSGPPSNNTNEGTGVKCSTEEATRDSQSNLSSGPPSNDTDEGTGVKCSTEEATRDSQSNLSSGPPSNDTDEDFGVKYSAEEITTDSKRNLSSSQPSNDEVRGVKCSTEAATRHSKSNLSSVQPSDDADEVRGVKCRTEAATRDSLGNLSSRPPRNDAGESYCLRCGPKELAKDLKINLLSGQLRGNDSASKCRLKERVTDLRIDLPSKEHDGTENVQRTGTDREIYVTSPTRANARQRSGSADEAFLAPQESLSDHKAEGNERAGKSSPRRSGNRSLSECEYPTKSRDRSDPFRPASASSAYKYKNISKSLESIDPNQGPKAFYYPTRTSLLTELENTPPKDSQAEENPKRLRPTISSPTLLKTPKGVSNLRAVLGPVFSVPGVRKLALQSAVPMANVVTRQKSLVPPEEPFMSNIPANQGEVHSVLSSIHPLKTLHGCIPLRQMENFLKEVSDFHAPELTPDVQKRLLPKGLQLKTPKEGSPLVSDLAASIPQGRDGIDMAEFECCESYVERVAAMQR